MKTVYKYTVPIQDEFTVTMPEGAKLLSFAAQNGDPMLWALVDPDAGFRTLRVFRLFGTGHTIVDSETLTYVGTVLVHGDDLVFHLFEVTP